jgi:manganese efflux pump family protein
VLRLLFFVLPLGLDSFAVAAAIGAAQAAAQAAGQGAGREAATQGSGQVAGRWLRLRVSLVFVLFEGGMPLIGLGLGSALARSIGQVASYLAAAAVIGIGGWMLFARGDGDEERAARVLSSHGLALAGLGISISLDELAIGFSIGLIHLPVTAVIVAIAAQAFLAAQLGLALGARIAERWRELAEKGAGVVLILLGIYLATEQFLT